MQRIHACLFTGVCLLAVASDARADLLFFTTGRVMKIDGYDTAGDTITVHLRGGGEVVFNLALVDRIAPDEVPDPLPAAAAATALAAPSLDGKPFADLIGTVADAYGLDARLVHAVVEAESNYQPRARSPKGAKGLMQLMPATARQYDVNDPYDPAANLDAGVRHLKDLLSRMDLSLALAAYNAGEGTIRRYGGIPPYPETRSYVRRILEQVGQQ